MLSLTLRLVKKAQLNATMKKNFFRQLQVEKGLQLDGKSAGNKKVVISKLHLPKI